MDTSRYTAVTRAVDIATAWLSNPNNRADANEAADFLTMAHASVENLSAPKSAEPEPSVYAPAVTLRQSLAKQPEYIVSMIDGKPYRTLRRHLSTHGLTPEEYRVRYGLKPDYPMVATAYSESRRDMAKNMGLGRKPGHKVKK